MNQPVVTIVTPGDLAILSGRSGSVELVVENVARRVSGVVKPIVFGKKTASLSAVETRDGVTYRRYPRVSMARYMRNVSRHISKVRPQLIQVENRPNFVRYMRKKHPKAEIWLSLHSLTYVSPPFIGITALRRCLKAADRIIVNSEYMRDRIAEKVPAVENRIRVNWLGVDRERFISRWEDEGRRLRENMLEKTGLQGRPILLYVGRWTKQKGVHKLLEAMPAIVKEVPDAMLIIIGGSCYHNNKMTPYVKKLRRLARQVPHNVRFVSYVPHKEIPEWYRLADVHLVPSLKREAFGLVNLEAMASGVPVIGTRVGGIGEIVQHGVTGYLLDPQQIGKQLPYYAVSLLKNKELAQCLGEHSLRRVAQQFTWQHTADRWLALLQEQGRG
ncbi:glycosyltransferase family 1 protein [Paenibacillus thalictri]|uniref:Glycosyltransferase family 1 protein n=1 Tax=Paenibacillus thalictri TaxID=2527873 RepID=A0A4Q9DXL6_9BACL|nr:glycosyltransferase family 1 protein [Paenibacillus thalictri]